MYSTDIEVSLKAKFAEVMLGMSKVSKFVLVLAAITPSIITYIKSLG